MNKCRTGREKALRITVKHVFVAFVAFVVFVVFVVFVL